MSKSLIIIGAGASFDYINDDYRSVSAEYCPPLARDLLNPIRFNSYLKKFPEAKMLSASIISAMKSGQDFEDFLLALKERGGHRLSQLADFQFYLHFLFQQISDNYGGQTANNYDELINYIKDAGGKSCILSFNYDLLLEQSIPHLQKGEKNLNSYINGEIQLIKLHGSCDWVYYFSTDFGRDIRDIESEGGIREYLVKYPNQIFGIKEPKGLRINREYSEHVRGHDKWFYYPAIAIPLPAKDTFICPQNHVDIMKDNIRQADKILIIGWKGGDTNLINVLKSECKKDVEFTIVSGNKDFAQVTQDKISAELPESVFKLAPGGLSDFIGSELCTDFFK